MLQEDYIFRPLYMLIEEITSKFSTIKVERIKKLDQHLNGLYLKYLKQNRDFFIKKNINTLLKDKSITNDELNVLAELFYRDALLQNDKTIKIFLLEKAKTILNHISKNTDTFSIERANRISSIEKTILS